MKIDHLEKFEATAAPGKNAIGPCDLSGSMGSDRGMARGFRNILKERDEK